MSLVLDGQFLGVGRIVDDIHLAANKGKTDLVLLAIEADAAGFIDLALLAVQEGVGDNIGVQKPDRPAVAVVGSHWAQVVLQGGVGPVLVALLQPDPEQLVEPVQILRLFQGGLGQELIYHLMVLLDLALGLRGERTCEQKFDTHLGACPAHPLVAILLSVVKERGLGRPELADGLVETILDDYLIQGGIELPMHHGSCVIIGEGHQVDLFLGAVLTDRQIRPELDVAGPKLVAVPSLKPPDRPAAGLGVDFHLPGAVASFHQLILQGAAPDLPRGDQSFPLQDLNDLGHATPRHFTAQQDSLVQDLGRDGLPAPVRVPVSWLETGESLRLVAGQVPAHGALGYACLFTDLILDLSRPGDVQAFRQQRRQQLHPL